ncbi:hypothetical protein MOUN0_N09890 [Monosporozyma unispora]
MSHLFRQAMQKLSYPTMIVTSAVPKGTKSMDFHGLTISSMTSLSINPKPLIQFNIKIPSNTSKDIRNNGLFAIHFLDPTQSNINLARHFSRGVKDTMTSPFSTLLKNKDYMCYFDENVTSKQNVILPILKETGKILICNSKEVFKVQDHEIWIGEVLQILSNTKEELIADDNDHGGLLHCKSKFFKLGDLV